MRSIPIQPAISDTVTSEIRAAILDGTLAPGSRIKQEELAARLQVSRAPVRHALTVLKREGLVHARRHRAIVAPLDPAFISDIYELREAIEGYAAARLAEREQFDPAPLWAVIADGQTAVGSGDLGRIIECDLTFHMTLYEALGNQALKTIMAAQWWHFRRAMAATLSISGYRQQVWAEHAAVLKAIVAGDPERARLAAVEHTRAARAMLLQRLKQVLTDQTLAATQAGGRRRRTIRRLTGGHTAA